MASTSAFRSREMWKQVESDREDPRANGLTSVDIRSPLPCAMNAFAELRTAIQSTVRRPRLRLRAATASRWLTTSRPTLRAV